MPTRDAHAEWKGGIRDGAGKMTLGSGAFEGAFSFKTRFEEEPGTNPDELIAAAHAGCFSMALSAALGNAGHTPESVTTTAKVHLRVIDGTPTISQIDLVTEASVPGLAADEFAKIAADAKAGCPVSRALAGVGEISLDATLASTG